MAKYRITAPDGTAFEVTAPDDATEDQVMAYAQQQFQAQQGEAPDAPARKPLSEMTPAEKLAYEDKLTGTSTNPTDGVSGARLFGAGVTKSLRDTGLGVVQSLADGGPMAGGFNAAVDAFGLQRPRNPVKEWADNAIAQNRQADAALMDTGAGFAGNMTGVVGQVLAPAGVMAGAARTQELARFAPALQSGVRALMPTTVSGGAAQGAALGYVQPVAEGDSRALNAGIGAGGGALGGLLPRVAGAGVRGLNRIREPLTNRGLENIAGRTLQRFATNPQIQQLADPILGRAPTLAEATLDPGIAQLQRAAQAKSPEVASAVFNARVGANDARVAALERFAGTPAQRQTLMEAIEKAEKAAYDSLEGVGDVNVQPIVRQIDSILSGPQGKRDAVKQALTKVRTKFFEPYEDSARIKDARGIVDSALGGRMSSADDSALREARRLLSNRAGASADEIVESLSGIRATSKKASTAIEEAKTLVNSLNVAYENQVPRLVAARQSIADQLSGLGDNAAGPLAKRELLQVRDALDEAIRKVTPDYETALNARRLGMRPINEMDTMTDLLQRASVPVAKQDGSLARGLQPSAFLRPTEDLDALARRGTGFRGATGDGTLSGPAQDTIEGIRIGLARQQSADSIAKVPGSPTAQFLAGGNIMDGILGQPKPGSFLSGLANLGASALDKPYAFVGVPERLNTVMARVLTDPGEAQRILAKLPAPDRALVEQAIGRISAPAGYAAAAGQNR